MVEQGEISIWVFKAIHRIIPHCSQGYEISWEGAWWRKRILQGETWGVKCRESSKLRATGAESMGLVLGGGVKGENVLFNCEASHKRPFCMCFPIPALFQVYLCWDDLTSPLWPWGCECPTGLFRDTVNGTKQARCRAPAWEEQHFAPLEFLLAHLSSELGKGIVGITVTGYQPLLQNRPKSIVPNSIF